MNADLNRNNIAPEDVNSIPQSASQQSQSISQDDAAELKPIAMKAENKKQVVVGMA